MRTDTGAVPTLVIKRRVAATPREVFELWTEPELMAPWMSPYPGPVDCEAEADVRVGGAYSLKMGSGESQCEIEGTYVDVDPPNRLVFTWSGPPTRNAKTLVTLELSDAPGGTDLVLTHERLPTPDVRQGHEIGWGNFLDHLADALGG